MLCVKNSGIAMGQTLQVARTKCMAKSCLEVQKNDFGERSTLFHRCFIDNGSGQCRYMESVRPSSDVVLLPCRTKLPLGSTVARQENNFDSEVVTESNQIQD